MKTSKLKLNKKNPRRCAPDKLEKLMHSIESFPAMMELRPIVYDPETMCVLGGNQRLLAIRKLGMKDIPDNWAIPADKLTEEQKREFILRDNVQFGDWDLELLETDFGDFDLSEMGLELPSVEVEQHQDEDENIYTNKVKAPIYEITGEKPEISELYDTKKYDELISEINKSKINESEKEFLRIAALRHIIFRYDKIAEFYAHASPELQNLMENSALVIIDFDKAIELGYVKLSEKTAKLYRDNLHDEDA